MLDVAVIGGGPAGSRVAYRLSGMGYRVALLEKRPGIGEKPCCTGIISRECVNTFGIPSHVMFREANSATIFSPSGQKIKLYKPETQAYIINRPAFDRMLAETAQSQGTQYYLNCKAENIHIKPDHVVVEFLENGKLNYLEAKVAVLAAGFNAALVKRLGFGQPGYLVSGVQAAVEVQGVDEVQVFFDQKLAPDFFAWLVPTLEGKALVGLMTRNNPGFHLKEWITKLKLEGKITSEKYQLRYGGIPLKPLTRTYRERLLIVGDAAGQVKPTTGGGIHFGLLCADMAAETIHDALATGDYSAGSMSNYEVIWRKKLNHELRVEYLARRIYTHLSNGNIDRIFSTLNDTGIVDSLLKEDSLSFDWHGGLMLKVFKLSAKSQAQRILRWPLTLSRH